MRVLKITSAYPRDASDPRGVFIHRLARALVDEGLDVTVLAPGAPSAASHEHVDGVDVRRATYWLPRGRQRLTVGLSGIVPNLRAQPWLALQVPPLVTALCTHALRVGSRFDVIHAHWVYPAGIAGLVAARWHRRPLVLTSHGGDLNLARRSAIIRWISRRIARTADFCVAVSEALARDFITMGLPPERVSFIPLGVEAARTGEQTAGSTSAQMRDFRSHDGLRLIYVGSLIPRKSVDTLLKACRELEERGHRLYCAIVGSGPNEDQLRKMAERDRIGNVLFAGSQPPGAVGAWLAAAHVLVLPSLSEGRPVAIMEAMANGVPVVATDIPGTRELVRDGDTGLLFKPTDSVSLADCIERLVADEGLRRQMGRSARARVESEGLLVSDVARRHIDLYEDLVGRRTGSDSRVRR